jgi:hypothetical protein
MGLRHTAVLLLAVVGLACTEKKELPAVEAPPPAFDYGLYCNEQGRLKEAELALWLARRPEHLERVYEEAQRGLPRAKALVQDVELVVAAVGRQVAQAATSVPCLVAPTPCHLDEEFLDKALVGSDGTGAKRLKAVLVSAYARRQYEREKELKVTFSLATAVLAGGLLATAVERAAVQEASAAAAAAAGEAKAVLTPEALAAEAEAQGLRAQVWEAERLESGTRYFAPLEELQRIRPQVGRPPFRTAADDPRWVEYVRYWDRRLVELEAAERAGLSQEARPKPPIIWAEYETIHTRFANARAYEVLVAERMWVEVRLAMAERQLLKGMSNPYMTEKPGVRPLWSTQVYYPDLMATDLATVKPGAVPRVYTFSIKQRNFKAKSEEKILEQITADAKYAKKHYGGTVEIRRPGHPLFGQKVKIEKVYLVYDAELVPMSDKLRIMIQELEQTYGVEVRFHGK